MNTTADAVAITAPAIASGSRESASIRLIERYLRLARYPTSASRSAAGSAAYLFGIGGFLVDFAFAVISAGCVIHCRMSSALILPPTPSSGLVLLPLPATAWHIWHFWAVWTSCPFLTSCAAAGRGSATAPAIVNATSR